MARVLGIGCIEKHANQELIRHANHVEYKGLAELQNRIDGIRSLKTRDQIMPWEVLHIDQSDLLNPRLAEQFRDIIVKEYGAGSDIRHYDYVSNESGPARNITVKFVVYPIVLGRENHRLTDSELLTRIHTNLEFLVKRLGSDRLLIELPNPEELSQHEGLLKLFKDPGGIGNLLGHQKIGLALDLDDLQAWAGQLGIPQVGLPDALPPDRVRKARVGKDRFDLLRDLFEKNRLESLEAVTYNGSDAQDLLEIKSLLRESGATLIDDALSVQYYFPEIDKFRHREIFEGVRYCFQALSNISPYVHRWIARKIEDLTPLLKREPNYAEQTVLNGTAVIEAGAFVSPTATVGAGSIVKRGAVVMEHATVEDGAVIGENVYVAEGARIKGGHIEGNVYVGSGVLIEGNCTIKDGVWIDDGVKVIRNTVIVNLCYIGEGTVIYSASISNGVILERHCELRPGTYIRKDAIFGDHVVFRSEAKNTVIMNGVPLRDPETGEEVVGGSESGHYGYCGDSILGRMVNEGAGDMNSNVKNDWGKTRVTIGGWRFASGLAKFGAIIGDFTTVGCLTVLEPGTLIGRACNVYGAKVRSWLQTATVYAEDQIPSQRWADSLPREQHSLEGRSAAVYRAIRSFEESRTKRVSAYP